jgi:uncharacterized protein YukJ
MKEKKLIEIEEQIIKACNNAENYVNVFTLKDHPYTDRVIEKLRELGFGITDKTSCIQVRW